MLRKIEIEGYNCVCVSNTESDKVIYMLYPFVNSFEEQWLQALATQYDISLAVVNIPLNRWNDDLTPWPEQPESSGFDSFGGDAASFLNTLFSRIIPECEQCIGIKKRDLMGVSLAGLFALWQWLDNDTFDSIACLSGSFWDKGFLDWFNNHAIPSKHGAAYFLLGVDEPKAKIKAYRTVGVNTEAIVKRLKSAGITTHFDLVPGNHFTNPMPRAEKALKFLSTK